MRTPTFWQGVVLALLLATAGGAVMASIPPLLGTETTLRFTIAALAFVYVLYLLSAGRERSGRIVVPCLMLAVTAFGWQLSSTSGFAALEIALVWLIRSLYHHDGVLAAALDLGLCALAVAGAVWALGTGSWFLAFWSFFLVQALFVWIPSFAARGPTRPGAATAGFEAAQRQAEAALKRLASSR